ncbi:amidoligase family protein [Clostridium estertheticum]|uniref:amidoligase family protein n=1 Tax=Clostridium estertheticum TaxID=238834 RepID=UPI001C6F21AF|nr:amidoligase family protein [Clostridium estertheticum]MBW9171199.1 amidoligase family protein [Clostridium estertheticum]WLC77460.1 amidoligase family protein [Clostridium estertheticum]
MKNQTIGVEIEMTGITRAKAAEVTSNFLGGSVNRTFDSYDTYDISTPDNRIWKIMSDASVQTTKKKKGTLISADQNYSVELVTPILKYEDIETLQELIRQLRHAGAVSESKLQCGIHVHIGAKGHTPNTIKNLVNLMASKEDLIYKSLEIDPKRARYCQKVNENLIETINKKKPKTLSELADIWYTGYGFENRGRHYHTSRYHGINLHSTFTKGTIEFRLFNGTLNAGKIKSYIVFCLAVSHQALIQKSASAKRTHTDNEKYTFRCWLLRLEFIGNEFKNCSGNSAWRHAA